MRGVRSCNEVVPFAKGTEAARGLRRRTSRIRNADLGRFTVDRLMTIINQLGSRVEVKVRVRRDHSVREVRA